MNPARELVEGGFPLITATGSMSYNGYNTFESNVPFPLRYLVDSGVVGGGWVEIKSREDYEVRDNTNGARGMAQIEIDVNWDKLRPAPDEEQSAIAPLRILSFDIECYNQFGKGFPVAESPLLRIFGPIMYNWEKGETEADGTWRARKWLFTGDHMKNVVEVTSTAKLGANFGGNNGNVARCIGCKVKINKAPTPATSQAGGSSSSSAAPMQVDDDDGTRLRWLMSESEYKKKFASVDLCAHCLKEKGPEIYFDRVQEVRKKQVEFRKLWTECQRCQDTIHQLIQCTNSDCPIFYRRQKVLIEMEKVENQLKNLQIEW